MAESNAMDRAQISALLDRAQHTINLAEQANNVLRLLKTPGTATVGDNGTLGTDTYLIPSRNITWPDNLYVNVFLDGMNAEATLTDYVASVASIPRLCQIINEGQGGMFRRLFNPTKVQAGDQAVFDLMVKLDEISSTTHEVSRMLEGVHAARTRQQQGVALFPGIHGGRALHRTRTTGTRLSPRYRWIRCRTLGRTYPCPSAPGSPTLRPRS